MQKKEDVRNKIDKLLQDKKINYAEASKAIGRNGAYIQQFIKYGNPERLKESDRKKLSKILEVPEQELTDLDLSESVVAQINEDFIFELIEKVDSWIAEYGLEYTPAEKKKLIKLLYKKFAAAPEEKRESAMICYMKDYEEFRKAQ
jgi:hypothetical protein